MSRHAGPAGSQRDRLLAWARAGNVIHQDDWYTRGADGGPPVKAVRSRTSELEAMGYGFHHTTRPDGTMEYRLAYQPPGVGEPSPLRDPGEASPSPTTPSVASAASHRHAVPDDVDEPRLFEPAPAAPRSALLGACEADAA